MKSCQMIRTVSILLGIAALLSGCEGDEKKNPGQGGQPSRHERLSPASRCLREHKLMQVKSFPDSVSAVKAFFRASVDCGPTEAEMDSFGAWLESRGVKIESTGGER
jgi:hypothetical protein